MPLCKALAIDGGWEKYLRMAWAQVAQDPLQQLQHNWVYLCIVVSSWIVSVLRS